MGIGILHSRAPLIIAATVGKKGEADRGSTSPLRGLTHNYQPSPAYVKFSNISDHLFDYFSNFGPFHTIQRIDKFLVCF
jgi:hypothetical protein